MIMRSCPLLRAFHCYTLRIQNPTVNTTNAGDVHSRGDGHCGVGPFGWVCTGLETLAVRSVDCKDAMARRLLFDQLCCMKALTSVTVGDLDPAGLNGMKEKRQGRGETK